jgi:hypothetical protein
VIVRVQCGFPLNSVLPRDVATVNPHYNITGSAQALVDALKTNLKAIGVISTSTTFVLKAYNAEGAPPHYPLAIASQGSTYTPTFEPNELALCLSYYASFNQPSRRGRLYIPKAFISGTAGKVPTSAQRDECGQFATAFGKSLPSGALWGVWSSMNIAFTATTNWFVDDEWDTVRSRGLRALNRTVGTIP